jgi:hypothetical protein
MFEKKNKYSNKHISLWFMYYGAICSSSSVYIYRQYTIYIFNSKLSFVCVTHTHTGREIERKRERKKRHK